MLQKLHIQNYAIIDEIEIDFSLTSILLPVKRVPVNLF